MTIVPQHCPQCDDGKAKPVAKQQEHTDPDWLTTLTLECGHTYTFPTVWLTYFTKGDDQ